MSHTHTHSHPAAPPLLPEDAFEAESRIRNLIWTVSGDYSLDIPVDTEAFRQDKYLALYNGVKEGAFSRYFDREALALYLVKKIYLSADGPSLMNIAQVCVDAATHRLIAGERAGAPQIRRRAFDHLLEAEFGSLASTPMGRAQLAMIQEELGLSPSRDNRTARIVEEIRSLETARDTMEIIRRVDDLYNTQIDRSFAREHGSLEDVLAVTLAELREYNWKDYLGEELEASLEQVLNRVGQSVTTLTALEERKSRGQARMAGSGTGTVLVDREALEKMYSYVELNYGKTYLSPAEQERLNRSLCRGIHGDCTLYFTDGILHSPVKVNYQYKYARKLADKNRMLYYKYSRTVKRNIAQLADALRKTLVLRSEEETTRSDHGRILPNQLWKVGRSRDPRLFERIIRRASTDFVVDILIDGSGSQHARQGLVAIQGYIISSALSAVGIPHRVMSFCTFWDYTIMRRFREYDEDARADSRIFEYTSTSNNRDGLAVKAAADQLSKRPEEHKILIVLSDGRPNDVIVNRPGSRCPAPYTGEYAVRDTALEIRRIRAQGIAVLGVFAGEEEDLPAEKKIFGKDFAYIREIGNFSNVVGLYLKKQLDND